MKTTFMNLSKIYNNYYFKQIQSHFRQIENKIDFQMYQKKLLLALVALLASQAGKVAAQPRPR